MQLRDTGNSVTVVLPVDSGLCTSDVKVESTGDSLQVRDTKHNTDLLRGLQLYSTIDPSQTRWSLLDGQLEITLRKLDPSLPWPALFADEGHASAAQPDSDAHAAQQSNAGKALAARDAVSALLSAAQSGDVQQFQTAAERFEGEELGAVKDGNGRGALHFAAQLGRTDMCRYLLDEAGVNVNAQDEAGETPLALAAGAGDLATVSLLIQHGADMALRQDDGAAPIHRAATSGSTDVVHALLDAGADVNAGSTPGTPLLWAAGSGQAQCVEALLRKGADPNARGSDNVSAMLMATATGSVDTVKALAAAGANPNYQATGGVTALHAAAESCQPEMVRLLLKAGADPNIADESGHTPLTAAAAAGCREAVEMLLPVTCQPDGASWTVDSLLAEHGQQEASHAAGQIEEAQVSIPEPEAPDPEQAALHKRRGDEAFVAKQFQQAADAYSAALRHDTASHLVWANRAASHLRLGDNKGALQDARRSRTLKPDYTKAWYREGCAAEALEQWEDAAQAYFEGYRLDPNSKDLAQAFQRAITAGQAQHRAQQAQQAEP